MAFIAPIVEGQGEIEAVPALLHRLGTHLGCNEALQINQPIRIKSGSFLKDDAYFRKYVALAAAKAALRNGWVLILLDCEDDCPARLGPSLLAKAQAVRSDVKYLIVLAYREFETWFIAAAESLRGHFGLAADLSAPTNPESLRDAKGWLGARMSSRYDPIIHQHKFTKVFDIEQARTIHSFNRFCKRLSKLIQS